MNKTNIDIMIVEDEQAAVNRLKKELNKAGVQFTILAELETVRNTVKWLKENEAPDLLFLDIQLADGVSFEIFEQVKITSSVIFTTAYDEYALQAIKVNSLDYLLKPIGETALKASLDRYFERVDNKEEDLSKLYEAIGRLQNPSYRKSFLVYVKNKMILINVDEIAYFFVSDKSVFIKTIKNIDYHIDLSLEELEKQVDLKLFYRANRQYLVAKRSIKEIEFYFNGKLIITIEPASSEMVTISREKTTDFKMWADQ